MVEGFLIEAIVAFLMRLISVRIQLSMGAVEGIIIVGQEYNVLLDHVIVNENTAKSVGGGISATRDVDTEAEIRFQGKIDANRAGSNGGGIDNNSCFVVLFGSEITNNKSRGKGGGIFTSSNAGCLELHKGVEMHGNEPDNIAGEPPNPSVFCDCDVPNPCPPLQSN